MQSAAVTILTKLVRFTPDKNRTMSVSNSIADAYLKSEIFSVAFFIIAKTRPESSHHRQIPSGYGCKTARREYCQGFIPVISSYSITPIA